MAITKNLYKVILYTCLVLNSYLTWQTIEYLPEKISCLVEENSPKLLSEIIQKKNPMRLEIL